MVANRLLVACIVLWPSAVADGFSASASATAAAFQRNLELQDKGYAVDQAAWTSPRFWADFDRELT